MVQVKKRRGLRLAGSCTGDMPSKRKKKLSARAAAAQAAQAAVAAAAVPRGRGRETKEAREARRSAEKVLRTHGVEPAAAADDPTGYAYVEQLAELNRRLRTAQQTGPAAAEQYRVPTPSPTKGPAAQRRLAVVDVTLSDTSASSDESESESDGAAEVVEKRAAKAAKRKAAKVAEKQAAKAEKRKSAEAAGGGEAKKKKAKKGPSVTDKSAHPEEPRAAGLLDTMTVSELFTHAREQGVSEERLFKKLDAADPKAAIIRLVETAASAGEDELQGMDVTGLITKATDMGVDIEEALACLDGAVSDEVAAEKLRALIRKVTVGDGMGGMSFAELAKRAESAAVDKAEVIACIRDGGTAFGQKTMLRGLIVAAENWAREVPKPGMAEPKAAADGDAEVNERYMGALLGAATAKDLGKAGQHLRSASLQRVRMQQAGGHSLTLGGSSTVSTEGPAGRLTKSGQEKLRQALAKSDRKYVDEVMHSLNLEMNQGDSPAMTEMATAAKQAGPQGASARYMPWSKRPQVSPPAAEFSGMRPAIKADQVDTPNILFPRWFLRDPDKLLSDSWKPKAKLGDYSWAGSDDKKDDVKLMDFARPEAWFQAATMLQMYAAQTTPQLMSNVVQNQHAAYCMALKDDMSLYGADKDRRMLALYVNFDERMRMHVATATDEVAYTEVATQLRHDFLEMPRKRLELMLAEEREVAMTQKIAQLKRTVPKREQVRGGKEQTPDEHGGDKPKLHERERMAMKILKRDLSEMPHIFKGSGKARKSACLFHNNGDCHAGEEQCKFEHFCVGCGKSGCAINICGAAGTAVGGGTPKSGKGAAQKLLGNKSSSPAAADGG